MSDSGYPKRSHSLVCRFIGTFIFLIDSFLGKLYNQSDYSDIELIIESEHFYAHRIILAARSEYFRALLYGGLRESHHDNHTIEIKECKADAFKILLLYIYTGRISLIKEKVKFFIEFSFYL
jgi:BTB/POZ domain-containing protein 9